MPEMDKARPPGSTQTRVARSRVHPGQRELATSELGCPELVRGRSAGRSGGRRSLHSKRKRRVTAVLPRMVAPVPAHGAGAPRQPARVRLAVGMPGAETFRASADAYDRFVGRYGPELATGLIDLAGVEPGMRTLDVGCGPGALAAMLVERLGAARVSAVDPSAPFVDACRARLPGVDVVEAGAEALPFADGAFDAALSQLVVNFMRDGEAGVREMARVTRPGGVVASCVWDYEGEMLSLIHI